VGLNHIPHPTQHALFWAGQHNTPETQYSPMTRNICAGLSCVSNRAAHGGGAHTASSMSLKPSSCRAPLHWTRLITEWAFALAPYIHIHANLGSTYIYMPARADRLNLVAFHRRGLRALLLPASAVATCVAVARCGCRSRGLV
jgi:hypothetical protein